MGRSKKITPQSALISPRLGGSDVYGITYRRFTAAIAALAAQLVVQSALCAQSIRVGDPVRLARELEQRPMIEPHIAAHPTDPDHLLAAMMVSTSSAERAEVQPRMRCSSFLSVDGGRGWARHDFPTTECFDPWVAITPDGRAVFLALGRDPSLPDQERGLLVYRSPDGGRMWDPTPVSLGAPQDHPTMVADRSAPERAGWIYIISSQRSRTEEGKARRAVFVARSRDAGKTFDAPVRILPSNRFHNAEVPVVLSDGTLVVSFIDDTWTATPELPRRGWVARSTDGGQSFSLPLFVTDACGPPQFALSAFAVDASRGPSRDRLYFACNKLGGDGVLVTASADGGETWSDAVPIHSAPPADATAWRHVRAMTVNDRGVLGVIWVDRWTQPDDRRCYEVLFAASTDGGRSFVPAQRLSRERHCMDPEANGANIRRWPTAGDYFGLTAAADGRFHAVWPEARDGDTLQLWTAAVEVDGEATAPK